MLLRVRHRDEVREGERYVGLCPLVRHRKMVKGTSVLGMSCIPGPREYG